MQEEPAVVAARMSPTNLGFLLNARQVACEFGFLTVPEFAEQTLRTLATVAKLSAVSRPPAQLVRHAHARTASAPVCFRPWTAATWWHRSGHCSKAAWIFCSVRCWRNSWRKDWPIIFGFWSTRHAFPQKRFRTFLEQTSKKSWLQRLLAPSEEGLLESDLETKNPKVRIGRALVRH